MTRRRLGYSLAAIAGLGLVLRVVALWLEPPHHPDEFFQYLEPAWGRLSGVGVQTWEWRANLRSWVLPSYHGAWMALLSRLGVQRSLTLATILRAHWSLLSLTLIWAGWRGGALLARGLRRTPPTAHPSAPPEGWQAGLLAALWCAAFPVLVRFSIHTLSELASLLCMVWALVLAGEIAESPPAGRGKALWVGGLAGLGVCLRVQHAPVALLVVLWLVLARRWRALRLVIAAALLPVALFGAVDWLTWGQPFASYVAYLKFNLIEKGADIYGKLPRLWYARLFWDRLPVGLPVIGLLCLLGLRASWPFVAGALGLVVLLSTQSHKEERFAMLFWPLVLIAAAGYAGAWLSAGTGRGESSGAEASPAPRRAWLAAGATALFALLVLGDGAWHCRGNDFAGLVPSRFEAQAWVGRQPDVTGLLYDEPLFVGGYTWFGRPFPQLQFSDDLLANPLFSHVLTGRDSNEARAAQRAGFVPVYRAEDFIVLARPPGPMLIR